MTRTRILLADDHPMVRRGLRLVLDAEPDLTVVAEAGSGAEALHAGLRQPVDLAVLDVSMPRLGGLQAAEELLRRRPAMRVLMLSMYESEQYLYQALKAGVSGYVLKSGADRDLVEACRAVMRGQSFLYPSAITQLFRDLLARGGKSSELLSRRESQIIQLVAEAHTADEIAGLLHISPRTVERHRENIRAKLGIGDRVELTRYAIRRGLLEA